jgi:NADPH:quinone reductase
MFEAWPASTRLILVSVSRSRSGHRMRRAGFEAGDRVGGVVFEDANAELVLADPRLVSHVPAKVDAAAALALVRGGLIALSALRAGRVAPGESVLVTAAASGTGHLAVQLAKALGAARVVAAAGSADKADFARQCGADEVVTKLT